MRLNNKQIEAIGQAWANLGNVGFLGGIIALAVGQPVALTWQAFIGGLIGWGLCQIACVIVLSSYREKRE
jgi:hypothetical protein